MKKRSILTLVMTMVFTGAFAQQSTPERTGKGTDHLNVGLGIGSTFYEKGAEPYLPLNPVVSYEKIISDVISIGGQAMYAVATTLYGVGDVVYTLNTGALYIGGRGSYHLNKALSLDENKFDIYGGASLGYVVVLPGRHQGSLTNIDSNVGYGAFAGAKYYFSRRTGLYAEAGYQSLSFVNVGLAFKF